MLMRAPISLNIEVLSLSLSTIIRSSHCNHQSVTGPFAPRDRFRQSFFSSFVRIMTASSQATQNMLILHRSYTRRTTQKKRRFTKLGATPKKWSSNYLNVLSAGCLSFTCCPMFGVQKKEKKEIFAFRPFSVTFRCYNRKLQNLYCPNSDNVNKSNGSYRISGVRVSGINLTAHEMRKYHDGTLCSFHFVFNKLALKIRSDFFFVPGLGIHFQSDGRAMC